MKVSVITCTYNSQSTILDTLQSVERQTYRNFEHIIIDGGSTDGTLEICRQNSSSNLKIISDSDDGIYDAFNKGIAAANGDIVGILNSDDYFADNRVLNDIVNLFSSTSVSLIYGHVDIVAQHDSRHIIRRWVCTTFSEGAFAFGWHPPHPGVFVLKSAYENYGYFDLDYDVSADFEMMLRLFEVNKVRVAHLPRSLVKMRSGGYSSTFRGIYRGNLNVIKAFKRHGIHVNSIVYLIRRFLPKIKSRFSNALRGSRK